MVWEMKEVICVKLEPSLTKDCGLRHQLSPICLVSALTPVHVAIINISMTPTTAVTH